MAKNDRIHYLRLLRADTAKYETNKFRTPHAGGEDAAVGEATEGEAHAPAEGAKNLAEAEVDIEQAPKRAKLSDDLEEKL